MGFSPVTGYFFTCVAEPFNVMILQRQNLDGTFTLPNECEDPGVFGDLNDDGVVDGADLGLLLNNWGGDGVGDVNGDGVVDAADLGLLLNNWG